MKPLIFNFSLLLLIAQNSFADDFQCESLINLKTSKEALSRSIQDDLKSVSKSTLIKRDQDFEKIADIFKQIAGLFPYLQKPDEFTSAVNFYEELTNINSIENLKALKSKVDNFKKSNKINSRKADYALFEKYILSQNAVNDFSKVSMETSHLITQLSSREQVYCTNLNQIGLGFAIVAGGSVAAGSFKCLNPDGSEDRNISLSIGGAMGFGIYGLWDNIETPKGHTNDIVRGIILDQPSDFVDIVNIKRKYAVDNNFENRLRVGPFVGGTQNTYRLVTFAFNSGSANNLNLVKTFLPNVLQNILKKEVVENSPAFSQKMSELSALTARMNNAKICEETYYKKNEAENPFEPKIKAK